MSLQEEIQTLMGELGTKVPAEKMEKVGAFIGRLADEEVAKIACTVGNMAPTFSLKNIDGHTVALDDLAAKGPVVIIFYRGEWCPFCDLELKAYQKALPEFAARGTTVVAISPQSLENSRVTAENRGLGFNVLSDPGSVVAKSYGLVFSLTEAEQELHKAFGADLPNVNDDSSWNLPVPATYVIDRSGRIAWSYVNSNYTTRGEPTDVIKAVDALVPRH